MSSNIMPEQRAISTHLTNLSQGLSITYFSGFVAALRDARKFTKRNQDNGQKLTDDSCGDHGSWLGAIGYLSLLDQIGKCFKPRTIATINNENSISKALKYFATHIPDAEVDAIYALRNAFAHDYSLYNINANRISYTHHFTVIQSPVHPLITLPQTQWDGNIANRTQNNLTVVNLEALGDTVEQVCSRLLQLTSNNDLEVTLAGGSDELIQRYSFYAAA
ncbi:MAG: hypothetical protein GXC78_11080 [Chitinophagaceae bacterium]|nr:hypothetical protein [Chitinophagaceae bacterium]